VKRAFQGHHRLLALALCAILAGAAATLHRDYGIAWDEPAQRSYGRTVARYVFNGDARLFDDPLRVYGPAHELMLVGAEAAAHARDTPDIFAVRHFANFLVFILGVFFLYRIGLIAFGSGLLSLVPCVALVLTPPFFAHAFFNSKDIPFLALFIVCVYSLLRFIERPRVTTALIHALASGWLLAIRVPGLLIPIFTIVAAGFVWFRSPERRAAILRGLAVYGVSTVLFVWALWPTLWRDPWASFWQAVQTMSRFPWQQRVLYAGDLVPATQLPWHYLLVWIAITTPLLYLCGFVIGVPVAVKRAWHAVRAHGTVDVYPVLVLLWLCVPLVSVVVFRSVLYDGWRHLFFVYPALLLIATEGFAALGRALWSRRGRLPVRIAAVAMLLAVVAGIADVGAFMIRAHPHEHVFFNSLAGGLRGARFRYEMDYWGLSGRPALEAILRIDRDPVIPVFTADTGDVNALALPFADRHRFMFVASPNEAKYFMGAYRLQQAEYPYADVIHRVQIEGVPIQSVARVHPDISLTPDTVPAIAAVRVQNGLRLAGFADAELIDVIQNGLKSGLALYVHDAEMDVRVSAASSEALKQGVLSMVRVRLRGGQVGDFPHHKPGIPVATLDFTAENVVLDVARLDTGQLPIARIESVMVSEFVLDGRAINDALQGWSGRERQLLVFFEQGALRLSWSGKPEAEAVVRLAVTPDPWRPRSDNLSFKIASMRVSRWRVPVASLAQFLAAGYSPVLGPDAVTTRFSLGTVTLDGQMLRLGTKFK
jgi:hypothetical protein